MRKRTETPSCYVRSPTWSPTQRAITILQTFQSGTVRCSTPKSAEPNVDESETNDGLSRSKLLAATGEFDIQSIQFLSLPNNGIADLKELQACTSLIRLDLRRNELSVLTPLKNMKALTALNLSANRITNIDSLGELESLVDLNLSGNLIGSFERLQCLQRLERLEKLRLFDSVKKLSNPICHDLSYDEKLKCMRLKGFGSQLTSICRDLDEQIKTHTVFKDIDSLHGLDLTGLRTFEHDEYCPCSKCDNLGDDERTFGPVTEYPIPSAWLRPGYFSLQAHADTESYAITEFREIVDECKKMNESAKEHIDTLAK